MKNKITILSLFNGIGGSQQALKNLGIENVCYSSEIDKYAIQINQKNFPDTKQIGDVKGIIIEDDWIFYNQNNDPMKNGGSFEAKIDLLIAGFPCQDLSIAKKDRQGLQGERSGLFYELLRIIKEAKPKHIVIENVSSMKKEWKDEIAKELGFGYVEINSALLTAQQRRRVYYVASLQQDGTYKQVNIEQPQDKGILLKDILEIPLKDREYVGNLFNKRIFIDKVGTLGTGSGRTNKQGMCVFKNNWEFIRKLSPLEYERLQGFPDGYTEGISNTQRYKTLGNSFTVPVIEHILKHLKL